ncbi:unnamed protein product [Closterium sp. Naga37s-1]|nr:unnamed protein product [Closterium sp. Naga37s-1]
MRRSAIPFCCGEAGSSEETRRSEERRAAGPRHKEHRWGQAPEEGEGGTWGVQRQEHGRPYLEDEAGRGDQGGGARGESRAPEDDTSRGQTQD